MLAFAQAGLFFIAPERRIDSGTHTVDHYQSRPTRFLPLPQKALQVLY